MPYTGFERGGFAARAGAESGSEVGDTSAGPPDVSGLARCAPANPADSGSRHSAPGSVRRGSTLCPPRKERPLAGAGMNRVFAAANPRPPRPGSARKGTTDGIELVRSSWSSQLRPDEGSAARSRRLRRTWAVATCLVLVVALPSVTELPWTVALAAVGGAIVWLGWRAVDRHRDERTIRAIARDAIAELEHWLGTERRLASTVDLASKADLAREYCPLCGRPTSPVTGRCGVHPT